MLNLLNFICKKNHSEPTSSKNPNSNYIVPLTVGTVVVSGLGYFVYKYNTKPDPVEKQDPIKEKKLVKEKQPDNNSKSLGHEDLLRDYRRVFTHYFSGMRDEYEKAKKGLENNKENRDKMHTLGYELIAKVDTDLENKHKEVIEEIEKAFKLTIEDDRDFLQMSDNMKNDFKFYLKKAINKEFAH